MLYEHTTSNNSYGYWINKWFSYAEKRDNKYYINNMLLEDYQKYINSLELLSDEDKQSIFYGTWLKY